MAWWRGTAANEPRQTDKDVASPELPEALLHRLEWTVLRRLDGRAQGAHRTFMRGGGIDLADLREYQPHDDVRRIDWNVTARLQQPHVRQFLEDRDTVVWFVLDLSPSLAFGSAGREKRQIQEAFVAMLGRLLTAQGNRVGAVLFGAATAQMVPAGGGRHQVLQLLHAMRRYARGGDGSTAGATRLSEWLRSMGAFARRRSVLFIVSDFISEAGWEVELGVLAQRHEVIAIRLFDPLEQQLPDLGMVPMSDAETGERLWVDTQDRRFRERFAQLVERREQDLRRGFLRAGVDALELSTAEDLGAALLRWFALRRHRSSSVPVARAGAHTMPLQEGRA